MNTTKKRERDREKFFYRKKIFFMNDQKVPFRQNSENIANPFPVELRKQKNWQGISRSSQSFSLSIHSKKKCF